MASSNEQSGKRYGADPADPVDAVAEALEQLAMWVRRNAPSQPASQLSTSTVTTLDTLASKGPLRISALAEHEAISQPGMTTLVNRLEAAGHAERVADPTDGRAALVRITEAGRAVLTQRHVTRTAALRSELHQLDPADVDALRAALPALKRLSGSEPTPNRAQPLRPQERTRPAHQPREDQQPPEHQQPREDQQPPEDQPSHAKPSPPQQQAGPRR